MDIAGLYELQKIDLNMNKARRRVALIRRKLEEPEELKQARNAVATQHSEVERLQARQLDAELNSRQLAERIQESERRLMSGEVRNARELEALQSSIESMKRQRAQIEEVAIESMQQSEEHQRRLAEQRAALARIENAWLAQKATLEEEETKYRRIYAQLKQQRQQLSARLGAEALSLYSQLVERKAGIAVAAVQNDACSACNMTLPTSVISHARMGDGTPVYCPSCGRILFAA